MQNRHHFKSFPAAEFYARGMLNIDWPLNARSYRGTTSGKELVSPLMKEQDAKKLVNQFVRLMPKNSSAIHAVRSRSSYSNGMFRVAIKLPMLTYTRDEFESLKNELNNDKERALRLLAHFLNETHAPFNEKFWGVSKKAGQLLLTYAAPSVNFKNAPLIGENGKTVYAEEHSGLEYEIEIRQNFNRQDSGFRFTQPTQSEFRRNLKSHEYKNTAYYYLTSDFTPALLEMIGSNVKTNKLEAEQRQALKKTRTSADNLPENEKYLAVPPSPEEIREDFISSGSNAEVKLTISESFSGVSGNGLFGSRQSARLDAELIDRVAEDERLDAMSSQEKLLRSSLNSSDEDNETIPSCCIN